MIVAPTAREHANDLLRRLKAGACGWLPNGDQFELIVGAINAALIAEQDRAAAVCEKIASAYHKQGRGDQQFACERCADAIDARKHT